MPKPSELTRVMVVAGAMAEDPHRLQGARELSLMLYCKTIILALGVLIVMVANAHATKLDYSQHKVVTDSETRCLVDGFGAQPLPAAALQWTVAGTPTAEKPAAAILDYETPVKVSALAHYFYVPGCRDQRYGLWLSGPSAYDKVKIYTSDDKTTWKLVSDLKGLPTACPQVLKIGDPTLARYLKIEVSALAPGATHLRSHELVTYTDGVPNDLPNSDQATPLRGGYPNTKALAKVKDSACALKLAADKSSFALKMPIAGAIAPLSGTVEIRVGDAPVVWDKADEATGKMSGTVNGSRLDMAAAFVKAGLLLEFDWNGPTTPPFQKVDVIATPDFRIREWCVPAYELLTKAPGKELAFSSAIVHTRIAAVSDKNQAITIVPDSDRSWIALRDKSVVASFPATKEKFSALVLGTSGDWFSGFRKAVEEVFDFSEPRQLSPVSEALNDICSKMLMSPEFWCEKYDTLYSTAGSDVFYIFYDLPYNISALMAWERLSDDPAASQKIDKTIKFALDQRIKEGPMAGAMFNMIYNQKQAYEGKLFTWDGYKTWKDKYKSDDEFIGMDQGSNHWLTSHTPGSVLWTIAQVWMARGSISDEMLAGAKDVAGWLVRTQREDGSWPYAFNVEGTVAFEESDSGTIWNVWALHRFAKLTGDPTYKAAKDKARAYFKKTFTKNHLYRGYWEDNMAVHRGSEMKKALNTRQGYESSIATMAYIEMGDRESALSSARDATKFVCTRQLESRDYWTSYGGVSEQQFWAPAFYLACPFGYAIQRTWRMTGDDFFKPFAFSPKVIGWAQQDNGWSAWVPGTVGHWPVEEFRVKGHGGRHYWSGWVSAQEVAFGMPWLVDELNRRSGDKIAINLESLAGNDDRGVDVAVKVFNGKVSSASNQVNWIGMRSAKSGEYQLALINHAEATTATVESPFATAPTSARLFSAGGKPRSARVPAPAAGKIDLNIPAGCTVVLVWAEH